MKLFIAKDFTGTELVFETTTFKYKRTKYKYLWICADDYRGSDEYWDACNLIELVFTTTNKL